MRHGHTPSRAAAAAAGVPGVIHGPVQTSILDAVFNITVVVCAVMKGGLESPPKTGFEPKFKLLNRLLVSAFELGAETSGHQA